mgnify:CR=1 FL=1
MDTFWLEHSVLHLIDNDDSNQMHATNQNSLQLMMIADRMLPRELSRLFDEISNFLYTKHDQFDSYDQDLVDLKLENEF